MKESSERRVIYWGMLPLGFRGLKFPDKSFLLAVFVPIQSPLILVIFASLCQFFGAILSMTVHARFPGLFRIHGFR
jgi:hypothetical protein